MSTQMRSYIWAAVLVIAIASVMVLAIFATEPKHRSADSCIACTLRAAPHVAYVRWPDPTGPHLHLRTNSRTTPATYICGPMLWRISRDTGGCLIQRPAANWSS